MNLTRYPCRKRVGNGDAACPLSSVLHLPCPSPILPAHPPSSQVLLGQLVGGPCPIFLPVCSPLVSASPIVVFPTTHVPGGLRVCPSTRQNSLGCVGTKPGTGQLPWDPPNGVPIPLPREAVPDPAAAQIPAEPRGWALPAAGTSRGAVSSSSGSGSPPPASLPARRGEETRPTAPCCSRGPGTHPAAEPGPVSRRGGGGNRASRDQPGAGTSGTRGRAPAPAPAAGESGAWGLGGLGAFGDSAAWGSVDLGSRAWWQGWWR